MLPFGFSVARDDFSFVTRAYAGSEEVDRSQDKLDTFKEEKEKKEEKEGEKEGEKDAPGVPSWEYAYIQMESVTVPIITAKGLTQQLSVGISLEVPYSQKKEFTSYQPRLLDAYIQDLYGALGAGFSLMRNGVVDVQQLKQRMEVVTAKVLPPELKAHDILLQVVAQQAR